jgi:hypothetical protein
MKSNTFFSPSTSEWKSGHGPIRIINFEENPGLELKDSYTAMGCITVITNNGKVGTLTHLGNEIDITKFVKCLDVSLGINKRDCEVFLVGGNNKKESKMFLAQLRKELLERQYNITEEITGGSIFIRRRSVLYQDKVSVEVFENTNMHTEEILFQKHTPLNN